MVDHDDALAPDDEKKETDSPASEAEAPQRLMRNDLESLEYSSTADSYTVFAESSVTGQAAHFHNHGSRTDATEVVHEMHLALLYLLSHPEEFQKALLASPSCKLGTTLAQWNAEYETESLAEDGGGSVYTSQEIQHSTNNSSHHNNDIPGTLNGTTPLPFVVFADDAEVVLPQAHTASQLFGLERIDGIELEAAAGIQSISQLFLRWLGTC